MAHVPKLAPLDPGPSRSEKQAEAGSGAVAPGPSAKSGAHDRELVQRAQDNDQAAYEELVARHQQRVFAIASGILRRREDVEDIAQQVFVKAYFSLKHFDGRAAFSTWLYRITLNECWDLLRKKKLAFTEIAVDGDLRTRRDMTARAHGRMSVPQIFFDNLHIGDSDELHELARNGKLDLLLAGGPQ